MPDILLVDDSDLDRTLAARLLEKRDMWTVRHAADGRQALAAIRQKRPDVVITDINMPEMNGLELLHEVVRHFPELPVVLITAKGSEEMAVEALALGAASYVPKKRLSNDLLETVERVWYAAAEFREDAQARECLSETRFSFAVPSEIRACMSVAKYLQNQLSILWQCNQTVRLQVTTAVEEALTNAYYYGSLEMDSELRLTDYRRFYALTEERRNDPAYGRRRIAVEAAINRNRATYTIRDEGPGFDLSTLQDHTDPDVLVQAVGRGVPLMKTFMDEVMYNETGNEVTLVKFRPQ